MVEAHRQSLAAAGATFQALASGVPALATFLPAPAVVDVAAAALDSHRCGLAHQPLCPAAGAAAAVALAAARVVAHGHRCLCRAVHRQEEAAAPASSDRREQGSRPGS
mmetsp:Transcript_21852/g.55083  ORF Transcript_21852/g.55083 Transcript_21852/m.55083 type:complete len:108 (-) Transcript_21852:25-348(-)